MPDVNSGRDAPQHQRRWLILCVIGLAQLMVVLDVSTPGFNMALTSADDPKCGVRHTGIRG